MRCADPSGSQRQFAVRKLFFGRPFGSLRRCFAELLVTLKIVAVLQFLN